MNPSSIPVKALKGLQRTSATLLITHTDLATLIMEHKRPLKVANRDQQASQLNQPHYRGGEAKDTSGGTFT